MIFEALNESAENGELILIQDGMLRFHRRRDGVVSIREILVTPAKRRRHIGKQMLLQLKIQSRGATAIVASCPTDLEANGWYARMGFKPDGTTRSRTGREINKWRLDLN